MGVFRKLGNSNWLNPGKLTRVVQFMEVSYTTPDGEPIPTYTPLFVTKAQKFELKGKENYISSTEIATKFVEYQVAFDPLIRNASKNLETLKIAELIGEPVYTGGNDSYGNPLINTDACIVDFYDIFIIQEEGQEVAYRITCRLSR